MSSNETSSTAVPATIESGHGDSLRMQGRIPKRSEIMRAAACCRCASKEESPNGVKNSVEPQVRLKPEYVNMLYRIFDLYCPKSEIWAYGSRVYGDNHDGSDLDLVVMSFNSSQKKMSELKQLISNSNLPFLVDITEYSNLPESFQKEIRKKGIVFYPKDDEKVNERIGSTF